MPRYRVCSTAGCPNLTERSGRCDECRSAADLARRPDGNPYNSAGHKRFRRDVLDRDPICTAPEGCLSLATVADHHPDSRAELIDMGLDADDPARGRGLCKRHHDQHTAQAQPGGWNAH